MIRHDDWPTALSNKIEERRWQPFELGTNDCFLFMCDCWLAMTGVDLAQGRRGYRGVMGARRIRRGKSFRQNWYGIWAKFGLESRPMWSAGRGDIILFKNHKNRYTLGIMALDGKNVLCPGELMLLGVPRNINMEAWH
ncbi:hypothetical protein LCGC14_1083640 [marine sediment metagenome]|uniref:DUF6950 domain-containing protein n=1 Tax=marine sediment metagenome TaxID=412755 RepID=A0A0F9MEN9_9ZZZZ